MNAKTYPFLQHGKDLLLISFGILLYVTGFVCFQLPYHITTGGVAGLGAVIFYSTGFPTQYTYLAFNIVLIGIALKVLGFKFMINTIYGVIFMTFLLGFMQDLMIQPDGSFPLILGNQSFMACIFGAVLEGLGLGVVFLNNGSTGGTDIIAACINKYRDMSLGQLIMLADIFIISSNYLVFKSIELLLFGYCTIIVEAVALDYSMNAVRQSIQFMIFSQKYDEIATEIAKTGRGVTVLDGEGWYTKHARKVLVVLCRRRESTRIFRIIRSIDPGAFVSQAKVSGVFGEGFDRMKGK
ncbi:MAG: YitT family protein [Bacteroidaceae bacterium]|nr:YitT family protein [Bacteroidaceae bacterium]